jgi:hypothetical protein
MGKERVREESEKKELQMGIWLEPESNRHSPQLKNF